MTEKHRQEAKVDYISKPGGVKVQEPSDDHWYNPVNENVKARVKSDLRQDDFIVMEYKDVPDTDNKRYLCDFTKPGATDDADQESKPQAFQQPEEEHIDEAKDATRYKTESGRPRVEMPTRHGALNTAIESLRLEVEAGMDLPDNSGKVAELIQSRADDFIEYVYRDSQQEWKDNKVRDNHE